MVHAQWPEVAHLLLYMSATFPLHDLPPGVEPRHDPPGRRGEYVAGSPAPPRIVQASPRHSPPPRRLYTPTPDGCERFLRECLVLSRGEGPLPHAQGART
jgi:hypothetical protein